MTKGDAGRTECWAIHSPQAIPPKYLLHTSAEAMLTFISSAAGTKVLTWNLGKLSKPGKSSMSPVLMLKQAPCQGQRTLPLDKTPA